MSDVYMSRFWTGTHPVIPRLKEIQERYFPTGESKVYLSRVKSANTKIKQLREFIHKHYRYYNDGDAFTISGVRAKTEKYSRQAHSYIPLGMNELSETNRALHLIEDKISNLTMQIAALTREERTRPTDQYGRIHRSGLPKNITG